MVFICQKNTKYSMVVWEISETTITCLVSFSRSNPNVAWLFGKELYEQQFYILRFLKLIQKENTKCRMVVREIYNRNNNPTFLVFFFFRFKFKPQNVAWLFGKNSETTILHFGVFNLVKKNIKCSMVVWEKFRNNNSTFWGF